jgi:hypothetical protein
MTMRARWIAPLAALALLAGCATATPRSGPLRPATPSPARVAAVVNGEVITRAALDARLAGDAELSAEVAGLDAAAVQAVKRELLATMISDTLIAQEAHRQGMKPEALRASILRDVKVTDAEIAEARRLVRETKVADPQLQRRRARLLEGPEVQQRARIRELLLREKTARALQDFALALRQQARIQVLVN